MYTMQPVLQIGRYDWSEAILPRSVYKNRLRRLETLMTDRGWSGVLIYGTPAEHGALCWLSGLIPRLAPAFALVTPGAAPHLVSLDNPRMAEAVKAQSWITDVAADTDAAKPVTGWLATLRPAAGRIVVGIAGSALMTLRHSEAVTGVLTGKAEVADADDAFAALLYAKEPSEMTLMRAAARLLDAAAQGFARSWYEGSGIAAAALAGEQAARRRGAQDARFLFSPDGGATFMDFDGGTDGRPAAAVAHFAVRHAGYWADGFVTLPPDSVAAIVSRHALEAGLTALRPGIEARVVAMAMARALAHRRPHAITSTAFGCGIGLSLCEYPRIALSETALMLEGATLSLRAGVSDRTAGHSLISALAAVTGGGAEILWRSP